MSEPLDDLKRLKVTPETMKWLRWRCAKTGKSFPEIARETLHEIATREMADCIHDFNLLNAVSRGEGHMGGATGTQVKPPWKVAGSDL